MTKTVNKDSKRIFKDKNGYFYEVDGKRVNVNPIDRNGEDPAQWTFTDGENTFTPTQINESDHQPGYKYNSAFDRYAVTDLLDWTAENTIGLPFKWAAKTETGQKTLPYVGKALSVIQPSKWYGMFTGKGALWSDRNTGFGNDKEGQALNTLTDWVLSPVLAKGAGTAGKAVFNESMFQAARTGWSPAVKYVLGEPKAESILNHVVPGQIGWAPAQNNIVFHKTYNPDFKILDYFPERWDAQNHGASSYGMWISQKNDIGMMNNRPYVALIEQTVKKPMIQIGELSFKQKNTPRAQLLQYARQNGADAFQFRNIRDNRTFRQDVDFVFNPSENLRLEKLGFESNDRIYPILQKHLQGEEAVKMFKEYGGEPIPEGSINGQQLRQYVNEAREKYGLIGNTNITDEEIAQALYKQVKEVGDKTAAVNQQGEPQILFRGDTKSYTTLKNHKLDGSHRDLDNELGTLFTGEFPGTYGDRFDMVGSSRYLDGWSFNPISSEWQWRGGGTATNLNKQKGYQMFFKLGPSDSYKSIGWHTGFIKAISTPENPNDLNAFIVRTPAMRNASREISVLNDEFLVRQPTLKTTRYKWNNQKQRIVDTIGDDSVLEESPWLGTRQAVKEHYKNMLDDAQKNQQGLLKSDRIGENGITEVNSLREEHPLYSYFVLPDFNKQNAKHILPYDLRIPRNWKDSNIFRLTVPTIAGASLLANENNNQ